MIKTIKIYLFNPGVIDRNAIGALKDSYFYLNANIPNLRQPHKIPYHISVIEISRNIVDSDNRNIELSDSSSTSNENDTVLLNSSISNESDLSEANDYFSINSYYYHKDTTDNISTMTYNRKALRKRNESMSRKSISSIYTEYLDSNNNNRQRLSPQVSYPSLYNSQNQPKVPLDSVLDKNEIENKQIQNTEESSIRVKPIQTFTFLSYEINVDTLVRLFIVA